LEELTALAEQQAELSGLLTRLGDDGWARPSRCDGWTAADVVLHLAQTNEMAVASAEGRFAEYLAEQAKRLPPVSSVDDSADAMVTLERGAPVADLHVRWERGAEELHAALAAADPHLRVTWVAGQLTIRTLTTTRLAETWIHTGDVAYALGEAPVSSERLRPIARLAWRTLPYAFAGAGRELAGPVAFELTGPGGEAWNFQPEEDALTTVRGDTLELCLVAARRLSPGQTGLRGEGPDAAAVLELVRTYA
jgi:uncharacterized protein (TIGR03084 family)